MTPDTVFEEGDFRNDYFTAERKAEVWKRVQKIALDLEVPLEQLTELALRFCLVTEAVSTVIPGMRTARHVVSNVAAGEAGPLTSAQVELLSPYRWTHD